jgi:hypothetical protein
MRLLALFLALSFSTHAQTPSPLNGNWNLAGNRRLQQFPLLSLFLQVNGTQIFASGDVETRCPNDPRNGGGAKGQGLHGDILPDGTFTIKTTHATDTTQLEVRGHIPPDGATTWSGEYTVSGAASRNCPAFQQSNSFVASPLAPVDATFSGTLQLREFDSPPPGYDGPQTADAKFTVTLTQNKVESRTTSQGTAYFYIPLVSTIQVKGSPCFTHGFADPATYPAHGPHTLSPISRLLGDALFLKFSMDDESQLNVLAVFSDPTESALTVTDARVVGGQCNNQSFHGDLPTQKK